MLNRKEIEDKVIEVVTETLALDQPAKLEDSFIEDLGADSIDIVTLIVALQDELVDVFEVCDVQGKKTLAEMVDYIEGVFAAGSTTA